MKRFHIRPTGIAGMLIISGVVATATTGQVPEGQDESVVAEDRRRPVEDVIPSAALLTERGTQLAARLRFLRQSELAIGEKHPAYNNMQNEIAAVKRELSAWSSLESLEFESAGELEQLAPAMNDRDLRQLVIQLAGQIKQLETRVARLEQRPTDL